MPRKTHFNVIQSKLQVLSLLPVSFCILCIRRKSCGNWTHLLKRYEECTVSICTAFPCQISFLSICIRLHVVAQCYTWVLIYEDDDDDDDDNGDSDDDEDDDDDGNGDDDDDDDDDDEDGDDGDGGDGDVDD